MRKYEEKGGRKKGIGIGDVIMKLTTTFKA
jgi:hypothetical protein